MDFEQVKLYLILALIALPPVTFWFWVFISQEKGSKLLALETFVLGMFSVLPLLLYKKFFIQSELWFKKVIDHVFELDFPGINELLYFLFLILFVAFFTTITLILLGIFGSFFRKKSIANSIKAIFQEVTNFGFLGLLLIIFIIFGAYFYNNQFIISTLTSIILLAGWEEYSKHLVVRFVDDEKFRSIDDTIIFSALVGLAFAFVENFAIYFPLAWGDGTNINFMLIIYRSILLVFAHALFSGIFGYFYGLGHFAKPLLVEKMISHPTYFFRKSLHKILHIKSEPTFREQKMTEGLIIATLFHATFNTFMEFNLLWAGVVLVLIGGVLLFYLISKKEDHKKFGLIGTRWVPSEIEFVEAINEIRDAKQKEGLDVDLEVDIVEKGEFE